MRPPDTELSEFRAMAPIASLSGAGRKSLIWSFSLTPAWLYLFAPFLCRMGRKDGGRIGRPDCRATGRPRRGRRSSADDCVGRRISWRRPLDAREVASHRRGARIREDRPKIRPLHPREARRLQARAAL